MYGASEPGVSGVGGGWDADADADAAGELADEPVVEDGVLAWGCASWIDIVVVVADVAVGVGGKKLRNSE